MADKKPKKNNSKDKSPKKKPKDKKKDSRAKSGKGSKPSSQNQKKKKGSGNAFSIGGLFRWGIVLGLWGIIFSGGIVAWYAADLPDVAANPVMERKALITIKAADGSVLARYGERRSDPVDVRSVPPHLVHAVLAIEDRRFYRHYGIDPFGIARAMLANLRHGATVQGGSTITQQLAKNLFLTQERTFRRKIQEALLAVWLERELSKDEILTAYLNRVYLGAGAYGVDAAAQTYFEKPASQLTLRESAMIAGLLKAPSRYSPLSNPALSARRTDVVLAAMQDAGFITQGEAQAHTQGVRTVVPAPPHKPTGLNGARYFADYVMDELGQILVSLETDMVVETTLSPSIQKKAEDSLFALLRAEGGARKVSQGAVVVLRGADRGIVAMIGGRDYAQSQFNRATQARRATGSAFKPFVYLAALEQGRRPYDRILDAPLTQGAYRPENFDRTYHGDVSLEYALALSLNTATVRLMRELKPEFVLKTVRKLGIQAPLERDLSLALGSGGVPLIEMVSAYAALADGHAAPPFAISRITDSRGRVLYARSTGAPNRVIAPPVQRDIARMLEQVIEEGTGQAARLPFRASGKTGTSQGYRDAWFIGFTPDMTAGVWLGNDDNSPMQGVTGGTLPARLWKDIMQDSYKTPFPDTVRTESHSGQGGFDGLLLRLRGSNP